MKIASFIFAIVLSLSSPALAATVTVAGFTTADISAARDQAGPGGKVLFPNGVYDAEFATASVADQTWILDRYAVIKRNGTAMNSCALAVMADGFRIRGGTIDANRPAGSAFIVCAFGFGIDAEDTIFQSAGAWGVAVSDAAVVFEKIKIRDTKYASCIITNTRAASMPGPIINRSVFDRTSEDGAVIMSGGCLIGASGAGTTNEYIRAPMLTFNKAIGPITHNYDPVAFEVLYAQRGWFIGNEMIGFRIGVSMSGGFNHVRDNSCQLASSYCIEDGAHDTIYTGNSGTGYYSPTPPESAGITVNPVAANNQYVNNRMVGWITPLFKPSSVPTLAEWANY